MDFGEMVDYESTLHLRKRAIEAYVRAKFAVELAAQAGNEEHWLEAIAQLSDAEKACAKWGVSI